MTKANTKPLHFYTWQQKVKLLLKIKNKEERRSLIEEFCK